MKASTMKTSMADSSDFLQTLVISSFVKNPGHSIPLVSTLRDPKADEVLPSSPACLLPQMLLRSNSTVLSPSR